LGRVGHRHRDVLIAVLAGGAIASTTIDAHAQAPAAAPAPAPAAATETASDDATKTEVAIIGPVLTTSTGKNPELRPVLPTDTVAVRAREVAAALKDSAQDLGLELDLTGQIPDDGIDDLAVVKRASSGVWVVSQRLEPDGGDTYVLRIVAVPPKSATMLVRVEKVDGKNVSARAVVMLRDFVQLKLGAPPQPTTAENAEPRPEDEKARSRGRPLLAASTTIFGLFGAYSLYKSSGNDDPRLLYPLLALGSGIGLGASLLAADEWDVTPASAWTVAGGMWWGVFSGVEIATGRDIQPTDDRFGWGFAGGLAGTTIAVGALAFSHFDEGDAAIVHSGAAFGTFTGGIVEALVCGHAGGCHNVDGVRETRQVPSTGLGYGAAFGLVGGGVLATVIQTTAQRVFFIDLGAGLGALAGASAGSPLVFKEETEAKQRGFLAAVLGGTAVGGTVAWFLTREKVEEAPAKPTTASNAMMPFAGVIGTSFSPTGASLPVYGAALTGTF